MTIIDSPFRIYHGILISLLPLYPTLLITFLETAICAGLQIVVLAQQSQRSVVVTLTSPSYELAAVRTIKGDGVFQPRNIIVNTKKITLGTGNIGRA